MLTADTVQIRSLQPENLGEAVALAVLCFGEEHRDLVTHDLKATFEQASFKPETFVAEKDNRIVGIIQSYVGCMHWDTQYFSWLAVHPQERLKGIARHLLDYAEQKAVQDHFNGRAGTFMLVSETDPDIYRRLGYMSGNLKTADGSLVMIKASHP